MDKLDQALEALHAAEQLWIDCHDLLTGALTGSHHNHAATLTAVHEQTTKLFHALRGRVERLRAQIATPTGTDSRSATVPPHPAPTRRSDEAAPSPPVPRQLAPPPPSPPAATLTTVTGRDGSHYPVSAAWAVDLLPRRVRSGQPGEVTVGQVMINDRELGALSSGNDGTWSPAIRRRMTALGIRTAIKLDRHVEMKVAQMMVQTGATHGEVVINHSPCGSPPLPMTDNGCHQILPRYLRRGTTLTVHGTTQDGEPFSETYEGEAPA
ncbi:DddA-like double-stranded DNA deaminase toxin [Saccharothrix xinjiangensis]|uniref:DddA-like double-stranded DNA deaminase toxin n=1 Tax=Saccharothrix xinjiangensis TaxID=204798 RepID=A0ABV9XVI1_9PSEU